MKNTKFTKGEWHLAYHPQEKFYSIHSMPSHPQDCGSNVLDENHVGKEVALNNAKLICAAPELLEALSELIKLLARHGYNSYSLIFTGNEFEIAEQAIKKAIE